ncbi:1-phosphatidylinositol-4,5-bisphosphate phosphodiesterase beta-2 [Gossypium australe]|uniref:1-phosphatidylinositol-4,5-bisphosphate phosphodiesterase beta-2 n=1 Tax=Gossypium australe TaxID=47621 RepID=A0A5B6UZV9_9ROSI|nr:1-phosphatidylinositol-4,5-bisphosphate phosphodiesterase beta-2 [Gossypium australe]
MGSMPDLDTKKMVGTPIVETGSQILMPGDDALSQAMLHRLHWSRPNSGRNKYVGVSYAEAHRCEFMSLSQGDRTVAKYEAEFMRLSKYAHSLSIQFEEGLIYDLKAKIIEEVKHTERKKGDRDKGQSNLKRDSSPSSSIQRPKK